MEHWQSDKTSLLSRTAFIFNNELLSDVRFIVGSTNTEYPAHKLLLSLASPVFEQRFSQHESENVIRVPDIVPSAFHKMLQYIYTDTLLLDDQNDASNVLVAAEKFKINHLQAQCQNYIRLTDIPPESACKMYDMAQQLHMDHVLKHCQSVFTKHTTQVLQSDGFLKAKLSTLEAIFQNDDLSAEETMIIESVIKWGIAECKRKQIPAERTNIRSCIDPLMKYLRFLSLSVEQFGELISEYDIFLKNELFSITMKLSQPGSTISLPSNICQNSLKRGKKTTVPKEVYASNSTQNGTRYPERSGEGSCAARNVTALAREKGPPISPESNPHSKALPQGFIENVLKDELVYPKPNEQKTVPQSTWKIYPIPLKISNLMPDGFKMDDICSILKLKVRRGMFRVRGLTIKLNDTQNGSKPDLQIVVRMTSSHKETLEEMFRKKWSTQFCLCFQQTLLLLPLDTVKMEVFIEGLQLQKCLVCATQDLSYDGQDVSFTMTMLGNQRMVRNELPFLIGQILYSCS